MNVLDVLQALQEVVKKSVSAAERKRDFHAGPGESFTIGPAGQHLREAWDLAGHADNPEQVRSNILRFAHEHGLMDHLPETAQQARKAEVIAPFQEFKVTKAWVTDGVLYREGWISTNDLDREKEITEPEAFSPVLESYFSRGAPLSSTHDTRSYPVGHLQKGALVRDGQIFKAAVHPTDPEEFTSFPETGTGFFARMAINDPIAASQVAKGNVGGCSYIASVAKSEPIPNGRRRFLEFSDLMETTIAAYPINPHAVMQVAKAHGYTTQEDNMTPEQLQEMINQAIAQAQQQAQPAPQVQKAEPSPLTIEALGAVLQQQNEILFKAVDEKITKATEGLYSREGVGRVGQVTPAANDRDTDPAAYIVKKAQSDEELDQTDKDIIARLTIEGITLGMYQD